jgi:hypothetical protein
MIVTFKEENLTCTIKSAGTQADKFVADNLVIPNRIFHEGKEYKVTEIQSAFSGPITSLQGTLTFPDTLQTIGQFAFEDCRNLTGKLVIPDSVTSIQTGALRLCVGFDELVIGKNVKTIGNRSFAECHGFKGDLVIPDSVTLIDRDAFENCYGFNGSLIIGKSVKTIGYAAFNKCSGFSGELIIPDNVTSIDIGAFHFNIKLTKIIVSSNLNIINSYVFGMNVKTGPQPVLTEIIFRNTNVEKIQFVTNCFGDNAD